MTRYGMVIDLTVCIGCYNCQISCKDEYVSNDWPPYSLSEPLAGQFWMHVTEKIRGNVPRVKMAYTPLPCQHCRNAPCITASTGGGVYRRADGIVIADPVKSAGQTQLPASCPYGAMFSNEDSGIAQKCTMCAHLLDAGWAQPRCVESCPENCISFGDLDNPTSAVAQAVASGSAQVFHPEYGTQPDVYYIGLPATFLAGAVIEGKGKGDYIQGATVNLTDFLGNSWSTTTNNFGDFEFEGLTAGRLYTVNITASGMLPKTQMFYLEKDIHIGDVKLFPV